MPTYRVIVLDPLAQEGLDLLAAAGDIEYDVRTKLAGEELRRRWPSMTARSSAAA